MKKSMKHTGLRIGGIAAALLMVWYFRAQPELSAFGNEQRFRVRPDAPAVGMVDIVMDTTSADVVAQMRVDTGYVEEGAGMGGMASRLSSRSESAFTAPLPMISIPRAPGSSDSASRGLFDSAELDPFAASAAEPDTPSWGWLADEVGMAEQVGLRDLSERRSGERRPRLLSDEDDGSFRTDGSAGGGFYFRRQDRTF